MKMINYESMATIKVDNLTEAKPLRVLYFIPNKMSHGGIEAVVMGVFKNIDRNKIQIDFLQCAESGGVFDQEIRSLGGRIFYFSTNPKKYHLYKQNLKKIIQENGYSIIHFHADDFASTAILACKQIGVKNIIVHSHNNADPRSGRKQWIKKRITSDCATLRLACSKPAGDWLFGKKKYILFNSGISTESFAFSNDSRLKVRQKYGIDENALVVGCVGHLLENHKHQSFLLDVLKKLQIAQPKSYLFLVGEGPDHQQLVDKISKLSLTNVIFAGNQTDTAPFYSAFDVFALPSYHEGLPISCLEAISNGLICLVSKNVPLATGLEKREIQMATDGNEQEWVDSILKFAAQRIDDGPKLVTEAGFDVKEQTKKLQELYLSLPID